MGSLIVFAALLILLWVLLIRPQRARQQAQQRLLSSIEPGDEILTVGGLYGIVQHIDEDDDLEVEIAQGIHVRIARRAVATVVKPEDDDDEDAALEGEVVEDVDEVDVTDGEDSVRAGAAGEAAGAERR